MYPVYVCMQHIHMKSVLVVFKQRSMLATACSRISNKDSACGGVFTRSA